MYKKNDPALLGAYPIGAESLRPSCRPLGFTSQPPPGAGSHFYPAQQDSARLLWALVGLTRLSWAFVHSAYALGLSQVFPPERGIISHTARRLDFGERTPAGCIDASHSAGVTSLPLGEAVGLYFYTAASCGGLSYSASMVGSLSRPRGWSGQVNRPRGFGSLLPPLCLYYSTAWCYCQDFF